MKRVLVIVASVVVVIAGCGPAGRLHDVTDTQVAHTTAQSSARAAYVCGTYHWYVGGAHDYQAGTTWNTNPLDCYQQSALKCEDRLTDTVWKHGGWVRAVGLESGVDCPSEYSPIQLNFNFDKDNPDTSKYYYICVWKSQGSC